MRGLKVILTNYLFNEFALADVWRARILVGISRHDTLALPDRRTKPLPMNWIVDCLKVGYGLPALKYLSRYLYPCHLKMQVSALG